jgi:hypothetical protein
MGQHTLWKHGHPFFLLWNNKVEDLISLFVGHILKSINLLMGLKELMDTSKMEEVN